MLLKKRLKQVDFYRSLMPRPEPTTRSKLDQAIGSYGSTLVLRHNVLEPEARAELLDKLEDIVHRAGLV